MHCYSSSEQSKISSSASHMGEVFCARCVLCELQWFLLPMPAHTGASQDKQMQEWASREDEWLLLRTLRVASLYLLTLDPLVPCNHSSPRRHRGSQPGESKKLAQGFHQPCRTLVFWTIRCSDGLLMQQKYPLTSLLLCWMAMLTQGPEGRQ